MIRLLRLELRPPLPASRRSRPQPLQRWRYQALRPARRIRQAPPAAVIFDQVQTIALGASAPPEVRAALAESLLAELARALARVVIDLQTCSPPSQGKVG
ncbi:hypothetical protein [Brevundimonas pondensis]|uniref:Uncharacterized protein n=1 Tax=Brevundimonas pondensis TaxID=2774189 RepID=A0ABX7SIG7_9CAUL|nr:hypothetical protein [Brevundimonas pondensis]QTC87484.1 hypothetical protein IFE19_15545 [Brevundimonas pondensis]